MNVEFHYYVVYHLAAQAGLPRETARVIAHASQFVDDSVVGYRIDTRRELYDTAITQNYGWWDASFPRAVYLPFHFFPGGESAPPSPRRDHGRNLFSCAANSPGVKQLLVGALKTRNPYRVGIALHAFADSYAHQNFSGRLEQWNALTEDSPVPAIGHAQALTSPDDFAAAWTDPRLEEPFGRVNNGERFLQAADKIYRYLCVFNGRGFEDAPQVIEELADEHLRRAQGRSLQERVLDLIIAWDIPQYDRREWLDEAVDAPADSLGEEWFGGYSMLLWLKDTLLHRTRLLERDRLTARSGFYESHLHRWNEAAKAHLREATAVCDALTRGA